MHTNKYFLLLLLNKGTDLRSDAELVAACRNGESKCLEVLFARHKIRLLRLINCTLHNTTFADDVLQETFITAWKKISSGQYSEKEHFSTWFSMLAYRAAISRARSEMHVTHPALLPEHGQPFFAGSPEPGEQIDALIQLLPERERQVIIMHDIEEMDYLQIGQQLHIRTSSARRNHERAVAKLRKILSKKNKSKGQKGSEFSP